MPSRNLEDSRGSFRRLSHLIHPHPPHISTTRPHVLRKGSAPHSAELISVESLAHFDELSTPTSPGETGGRKRRWSLFRRRSNHPPSPSPEPTPSSSFASDLLRTLSEDSGRTTLSPPSTSSRSSTSSLPSFDEPAPRTPPHPYAYPQRRDSHHAHQAHPPLPPEAEDAPAPPSPVLHACALPDVKALQPLTRAAKHLPPPPPSRPLPPRPDEGEGARSGSDEEEDITNTEEGAAACGLGLELLQLEESVAQSKEDAAEEDEVEQDEQGASDGGSVVEQDLAPLAAAGEADERDLGDIAYALAPLPPAWPLDAPGAETRAACPWTPSMGGATLVELFALPEDGSLSSPAAPIAHERAIAGPAVPPVVAVDPLYLSTYPFCSLTVKRPARVTESAPPRVTGTVKREGGSTATPEGGVVVKPLYLGDYPFAAVRVVRPTPPTDKNLSASAVAYFCPVAAAPPAAIVVHPPPPPAVAHAASVPLPPPSLEEVYVLGREERAEAEAAADEAGARGGLFGAVEMEKQRAIAALVALLWRGV
ncbi:hypothetical protein JCM10450v2_007644 [Rhodotorula kratochvilovae]